MGLKKMLAQGVANEQEQLSKVSTVKEETLPVTNRVEPDVPASAASPQKNKVKKPEKKNPGGRPTNKEKGIQSRKQYTLTLKEETYLLILEAAREDDLSFAKFMERAALDYINNH